jgi:hypothetical protein
MGGSKKEYPRKMDYLDYFVAGIPAGALFKLNFDKLIKVAEASEESSDYGLNTIAEICLVAIVSYFESFCKNNYASTINICPRILKNIEKTRKDITFDIEELRTLNFHLNDKIGFIISEKLDFGSAKNINGLYNELLGFSPFSKDEILKYNDLLNDRNLLVHHGGIYTLKYGRQTIKKQATEKRIFLDSLVIRKKDFKVWAEFVEAVVKKVINKSYENLTEFINNNQLMLQEETLLALKALKWYD